MCLHKECRDELAWCDIVRFRFFSYAWVKVGDTLRLAVRWTKEESVQLHEDEHWDERVDQDGTEATQSRSIAWFTAIIKLCPCAELVIVGQPGSYAKHL